MRFIRSKLFWHSLVSIGDMFSFIIYLLAILAYSKGLRFRTE